MLLKDKLDFILKTFGLNFSSTGKKFPITLAKDEKKIDYNNLFFKLNKASVVKNIDFLNEIGPLYDLLIFLLDNSMRIVTSTETRIDFFKAITVLRIIISNMKTGITDQSDEEEKKNFAEQEDVLSNAEMLLKKRGELINQFSKNNTISKNEKLYDVPKKSEEIYRKTKLKINSNKGLTTMIDNKRYTPN